jgi:hypothetical protein
LNDERQIRPEEFVVAELFVEAEVQVDAGRAGRFVGFLPVSPEAWNPAEANRLAHGREEPHQRHLIVRRDSAMVYLLRGSSRHACHQARSILVLQIHNVRRLVLPKRAETKPNLRMRFAPQRLHHHLIAASLADLDDTPSMTHTLHFSHPAVETYGTKVLAGFAHGCALAGFAAKVGRRLPDYPRSADGQMKSR